MILFCSTRIFIIAVCVFALLSTAIYFSINEYYGERNSPQMNPVSQEKTKSQAKEETTLEYVERPEDIKISAAVKKYFGDKNGAEMNPVRQEKSENQDEEKTNLEYAKRREDIKISAGSIFLKSFLKDMVCALGKTYSVTCCGKLNLSEWDTDNSTGCVIMELFDDNDDDDDDDDDEYDDNKTTYQMKFMIQNDVIMQSEVNGFPEPNSKCFPLTQYPGKEFCVSVNLIVLDNNVSDADRYETCTLLNFGYASDESDQLLGYTENVGCDVNRILVMKKSLDSPFALVIRLKVNSLDDEGKEEDRKPKYERGKLDIKVGDIIKILLPDDPEEETEDNINLEKKNLEVSNFAILTLCENTDDDDNEEMENNKINGKKNLKEPYIINLKMCEDSDELENDVDKEMENNKINKDRKLEEPNNLNLKATAYEKTDVPEIKYFGLLPLPSEEEIANK